MFPHRGQVGNTQICKHTHTLLNQTGRPPKGRKSQDSELATWQTD